MTHERTLREKERVKGEESVLYSVVEGGETHSRRIRRTFRGIKCRMSIFSITDPVVPCSVLSDCG